MYLPWKNLVDPLRTSFSKPAPVGNPPAPRLVFRVGVTADLLTPGSAAAGAVLAEVLEAVAAETNRLASEFAGAACGYCAGPPELRLLTQLATHGDLLAANEGLHLSYRVHAVLPFHKDDFPGDFAAGADEVMPKQKFTSAVGAVHAFELPGDPRRPESRLQAYAEANRVILNQIDLLVAVAPDAPDRYAGSVWMSGKAVEQRIPVIRIPPHDPRAAELTWSTRGQRCRQHLYRAGGTALDSAVIGSLLKGILKPSEPDRAPRSFTQAYLARVPPQTGWDHCSDDSTEQWKVTPDDEMVIGALGSTPERIDESFCAQYCWADRLARGYGEIYRGTAVLSSLLGPIAVAAAVLALAIPLHQAEVPLKSIEVLLILLVNVVYWREQKVKWRVRWLNYRQLAEQLRHARYLALLGRGIPVDVPAHMQEFHDEAR
jgi:hypothetical protein